MKSSITNILQRLRDATKTKKAFAVGSMLALLLITIPVTLSLVQTRQDIRQQAAEDDESLNYGKYMDNGEDIYSGKSLDFYGGGSGDEGGTTSSILCLFFPASKNCSIPDAEVTDTPDQNNEQENDDETGEQQTLTSPSPTINSSMTITPTGPAGAGSGNNYVMAPVTFLAGDANNDKEINLLDYNVFLSCFNADTSCSNERATGSDFNNDGDVDLFDFNLYLRELSRHLPS